mmetsp:Transcript_63834/g.172264  ORF Transcript_63834/g.172264 Transcript_63834/m.172264 type:complete len:211 (-) Transcript_63834:61-693(-)
MHEAEGSPLSKLAFVFHQSRCMRVSTKKRRCDLVRPRSVPLQAIPPVHSPCERTRGRVLLRRCPWRSAGRASDTTWLEAMVLGKPVSMRSVSCPVSFQLLYSGSGLRRRTVRTRLWTFEVVTETETAEAPQPSCSTRVRTGTARVSTVALQTSMPRASFRSSTEAHSSVRRPASCALASATACLWVRPRHSRSKASRAGPDGSRSSSCAW